MNKEIFGIAAPEKECNDQKCPFHGVLNVKKKSFVGTIISSKMHNSAVIEMGRRIVIPKYERYAKRRTRIHVHNPECINAQEGDIVKVFLTRPISKTINFVIVENMGKEKHYEENKELLEEGKIKSEDQEENNKEEPSKEVEEEKEDESI